MPGLAPLDSSEAGGSAQGPELRLQGPKPEIESPKCENGMQEGRCPKDFIGEWTEWCHLKDAQEKVAKGLIEWPKNRKN